MDGRRRRGVANYWTLYNSNIEGEEEDAKGFERQAARRKSTKQNNQDSRDGIGGRPEGEADGGARVYIAVTFSGQGRADAGGSSDGERDGRKLFPFFFSSGTGRHVQVTGWGGHGCPKTARRDGSRFKFSAFHLRLVGGEGGRGLGEGEQQCPLAGCEEGVGGAVSSGPRNETIAVHVPGTLCHEAAVPKVPHPKRPRCWQQGHGGLKHSLRDSSYWRGGF